MSVKLEKISGCRVKLSFTSTEEEFEKALDKAFEVKVKDVKVDGFRPGKLPRSVYNQKFGEESLFDEAINIILNETYYDAIVSKKLDICSEPTIDVDFKTVGRGKKMKYTIEVDVYPEVTLGQYKGIEVEREKVSVTAKDVTEKINHTLDNYAELVVVEDKALENGNTAVFDFEGSVDGVPFDGGKAENYSLVIGSHQFIPGFEEQMVGMKKGEERDINVKFPEDYQAENLAGKDSVFHIVLHEIKERKLPELNDEFVAGLEIEGVKTVDEYKKFTKEAIKKDREEAADNKLNDDIINKAVENATLEVPEGLVLSQQNRHFRQLENQAKNYGMPIETLLGYYGIKDKQAYMGVIKDNCVQQVKHELVFEAIAKEEKIKVSDKDWENELQVICNETDKPVEELKKVYTKEALTPYITMTKAMELVKKEAIRK